MIIPVSDFSVATLSRFGSRFSVYRVSAREGTSPSIVIFGTRSTQKLVSPAGPRGSILCTSVSNVFLSAAVRVVFFLVGTGIAG